MLETLAKDTCFEVRLQLTTNPNTTIGILKTLAKDKEWAVRRFVGLNTKVTQKILLLLWEIEKIEQDKNSLLALYKNKLTPAWLKACIETMFPWIL